MTPEQIEAYVDAAAAALQLPLAPAHRPGVLHYFALAATLADMLDADALRITDDPAETFLPVEPVPPAMPSTTRPAGDAASLPGTQPR